MESSDYKLDTWTNDTIFEDIWKIDERLYLSDGPTAHWKSTLNKYNITHVVNSTHNLVSKFKDEILYIVKKSLILRNSII